MLAKWLLNWLILSVSVFVVTRILPSVRIKGFATAVFVAFVYGILNLLLTQILVFLSLPCWLLHTCRISIAVAIRSLDPTLGL
jgi:putative membrane protein